MRWKRFSTVAVSECKEQGMNPYLNSRPRGDRTVNRVTNAVKPQRTRSGGSVLRAVALTAIAALVLAGGWAAVSSDQGAVAQDAVPADLSGHPVVGAWAWDTDADDPANALSYGILHPDGTYIELHPLVGAGVGVWLPSGERTADLTIFFQDIDPTPDGVAPGTLIIRVAIEVSPAGDALTAPFTSEGRAPDGTVLFANAFTATATRLEVEPMVPLGTPEAATPAA
jgi:hypothetical protein